MPPVVPALLALNIVVFLMWLLLGQSQFMIDNFLISWDALAAGRYWTVLTSAFSHIAFLHIFLNMYVLVMFGSIVEAVIGSGRFLRFYLVAAVISSISHAAVSAFLLHKPDLPALGASGAISGVVLVFCFLFPRARLLLFAIIPMPAIVGAILFVGIDAIGLYAQAGGGGLPIGHGAHLGGAATGALYYLFFLRGQRLQHWGPRDYSDVTTWRSMLRQYRRPDWDGDER
ncbi:MAG: rhomboid family intramembrane serine protease [Alphaproteobacteria bacterium]|nr:rhomboid family intramembrane serine protease [Alphaproteobacteria bacterium]